MMVRVYDVKGQGLSMSTIILAALALIVLVILATFLLGGTGGLSDAMDCEKNGGECNSLVGANSNQYNCNNSQVEAKSYSCPSGEGCCLPLGN